MPSSKEKGKKAAAPSTSKASDEIDSIFANPKASTSKTTLGELAAKKPKKKRKKPSAQEEDGKVVEGTAEQEDEQVKRSKPKVVEVVDTSSNLGTEVQKQPLPNDVEELMDSRGNKRRRTDDGLPIYDAAELKIGLGGDTDHCPFDCDCCF